MHGEQWPQRVLNLAISSLWLVFSVLDYGLRFTTTSQIGMSEGLLGEMYSPILRSKRVMIESMYCVYCMFKV